MNKVTPESYLTRMPYPTLPPGFSQNTNYQWSNYNAGYVKFEQRLWHDLSYTVAYTFSKLMDSGAAGMNMYNRRPEREPAPNNVPHNFIVSYVWQLPVGKGKSDQHSEPDSGRRHRRMGNERDHQLPVGHELHDCGGERPGQRAGRRAAGRRHRSEADAGSTRVRMACWALTAPPTPRPPRRFSATWAATPSTASASTTGTWASTRTSLSGRWAKAARLQIRAEWFNFFNHTQFNNPSATVNVTSNFGLVNSTRDPRILQLAGKLYW